MQITIPVWSEQDLTPRAVEVIRAIVDAAYPDHVIKFKPYNRTDKKVLVFGRAPSSTDSIEFIYTYSIAQIMSKPNAASVLTAGLRQFLSEPDPIPFEFPLGTKFATVLSNHLDPDLPTAIDIETTGNLGKTHTPEDVEVLSIAFYQAGKAPIVFINPRDLWDTKGYALGRAQLRFLAGYLPKFTKAIYHNGKFDTRVLNRVLGVKLCVWFDTMLAHHVLNHAAGDHKLKTAARRYVGAPDWEGGLGQWTVGGGHYENIPTDKLVEYNGWDVYWTYKLWEFFAPLIEADDRNITAFQLEMAAATFLLDVEKYGIPFNGDYSLEYYKELEQRMVPELEKLQGITGNPKFNPASWKQVQDWLRYHYDSRVTSTNEEAIEAIKEDSTEGLSVWNFCDALIKYRKASKIKGTYVVGWEKKVRDGRVHPTYLVHGTTTGRLSSTGPNAQNVPRDKEIRKLVTTHG